MSIKINVACPVCHQTLSYQHEEAEAWGTIAIDDYAISEITAHDKGQVIGPHMAVHRQDGTWLKAYEDRLRFQAGRAERYFSEIK